MYLQRLLQAALVCGVMGPASAYAQDAPTIPYSGYLEADGEAVSNETRTFRFTFEPADGTPAATWQREYALDVVAGRFAVTFGADAPLNGQTLELPGWAQTEPSLSLAVALQEPDGDWVLLGRQVLRPSRYALTSTRADGFTVEGNLTVTGNVSVNQLTAADDVFANRVRTGSGAGVTWTEGDIAASDDLQAGDDLFVSDYATIDNRLSVGTCSAGDKDICVEDDLIVGDDVNAPNNEWGNGGENSGDCYWRERQSCGPTLSCDEGDFIAAVDFLMADCNMYRIYCCRI